MTWGDCTAVETIAGKVSETPTVKGTRVPAQTIVDNFRVGVGPSEIAEQFDVPLAVVQQVIAFATGAHEPGLV